MLVTTAGLDGLLQTAAGFKGLEDQSIWCSSSQLGESARESAREEPDEMLEKCRWKCRMKCWGSAGKSAEEVPEVLEEVPEEVPEEILPEIMESEELDFESAELLEKELLHPMLESFPRPCVTYLLELKVNF